jgi:hypothetical protein
MKSKYTESGGGLSFVLQSIQNRAWRMLRKVKEIRNSIIQLHAIKINVGLQTLFTYKE